MITGLYAAIFVLIQMVMVIWIARSRVKEKVSLGDGGDDSLLRKTRVYGNFTEVVPMALLLMLLVEMNTMIPWIVHLMGTMMMGSRVLHALGLLTGPGYGLYRMVGMLLTMAVFIIGAALCVVHFL